MDRKSERLRSTVDLEILRPGEWAGLPESGEWSAVRTKSGIVALFHARYLADLAAFFARKEGP